jgi:hypothetical protein
LATSDAVDAEPGDLTRAPHPIRPPALLATGAGIVESSAKSAGWIAPTNETSWWLAAVVALGGVFLVELGLIRAGRRPAAFAVAVLALACTSFNLRGGSWAPLSLPLWMAAAAVSAIGVATGARTRSLSAAVLIASGIGLAFLTPAMATLLHVRNAHVAWTVEGISTEGNLMVLIIALSPWLVKAGAEISDEYLVMSDRPIDWLMRRHAPRAVWVFAGVAVIIMAAAMAWNDRGRAPMAIVLAAGLVALAYCGRTNREVWPGRSTIALAALLIGASLAGVTIARYAWLAAGVALALFGLVQTVRTRGRLGLGWLLVGLWWAGALGSFGGSRALINDRVFLIAALFARGLACLMVDRSREVTTRRAAGVIGIAIFAGFIALMIGLLNAKHSLADLRGAAEVVLALIVPVLAGLRGQPRTGQAHRPMLTAFLTAAPRMSKGYATAPRLRLLLATTRDERHPALGACHLTSDLSGKWCSRQFQGRAPLSSASRSGRVEAVAPGPTVGT